MQTNEQIKINAVGIDNVKCAAQLAVEQLIKQGVDLFDGRSIEVKIAASSVEDDNIYTKAEVCLVISNGEIECAKYTNREIFEIKKILSDFEGKLPEECLTDYKTPEIEETEIEM